MPEEFEAPNMLVPDDGREWLKGVIVGSNECRITAKRLNLVAVQCVSSVDLVYVRNPGELMSNEIQESYIADFEGYIKLLEAQAKMLRKFTDKPPKNFVSSSVNP